MKKQILLVAAVLLLGFSIVAAQTRTVPKDISGGVLNGKARDLPAPEFPAAAKAVNAGGAVNVKVTIDENGNVTESSAVSGHPLLRQAAENAARQAVFAPTQLSGQPVKVTGIIVYNFTPAANSNASSQAPVQTSGNSIIIGGGSVVNGKATNLVVPAYPPAAKAVKAGGAVNVQVLIDENGDVVSANAVSGHPLLRQAAVTAASASKFSPTMLSGQAVKVTGIVVYNFTAGDSAAEHYNWLKVGYDLTSVQYAPTMDVLNVNTIGNFFQPDWTSENQQLQRLAEIKKAESDSFPKPNTISGGRKVSEDVERKSDGMIVRRVITERPVNPDNQPTGEQIAVSQSLTAALQSRLGSDQMKLWQFNTGASLSRALSKLRFTGERQSVLDSFNQQIQNAPSGVSPEYLADLQAMQKLLEKQNPTVEDRDQVPQLLQKLFRNQ